MIIRGNVATSAAIHFLGASSLMCWFNNKEFSVLYLQSNTTIFHLVVQ